MIKGSQHTVTWHVDNLKSSHKNPKINDKFLKWLKRTYASDNIGKIKAVRGKKHDYLAMSLDYETPGVLKVDMTAYVKRMIDKFPKTLQGKTRCPWNETLFKVDKKSNKLNEDKRKKFILLL